MAARTATARSRDEGSEVTRRAILDAAAELLASVGEDGLSIREVCSRAGVTAPTIYHHFGDKAALIDRIVDDRFADFDRTFARRAVPTDPVEALRWSFGRYVEFGVRYPAHYRVMFEGGRIRPTRGSLASYDALRRRVAAIDAAGRLRAPVDDATAAFWASVHGVTSLTIRGSFKPQSPAVALVREAMISQLTRGARERARRNERTRHE